LAAGTVALAAHLNGPLMNLLVIDVFALFPFQGLFTMAGIAAIPAMGFFFFRHIKSFLIFWPQL